MNEFGPHKNLTNTLRADALLFPFYGWGDQLHSQYVVGCEARRFHAGPAALTLDCKLQSSDCSPVDSVYLVPRPLSEQEDTWRRGIKKLRKDETHQRN